MFQEETAGPWKPMEKLMESGLGSQDYPLLLDSAGVVRTVAEFIQSE